MQGPAKSTNNTAITPRHADRMPGTASRAADQGKPLSIDRIAQTRRTSLSLPTNLPIETWRRLGEQMALITDSSAWWLGDWLVYGKTEYKGRYAAALAKTPLDYQTLRNYAWIARKFKVSRRRDGLSFQHHVEVAGLPENEQDFWLDLAEKHGWSKNQLRKELRQQLNGDKEAAGENPRHVSLKLDVAPEREEKWNEAANKMNYDILEWIITTLDSAAASLADSLGQADSEVRRLTWHVPGNRPAPPPDHRTHPATAARPRRASGSESRNFNHTSNSVPLHHRS